MKRRSSESGSETPMCILLWTFWNDDTYDILDKSPNNGKFEAKAIECFLLGSSEEEVLPIVVYYGQENHQKSRHEVP